MLILAQGTSKRWARPHGGLYLDRPKHFVEVDGETLIARTVRLFTERGCDVVVVAPDEPRYHVGAPVVELEDPYPSGQNLDKLLGTVPLWSVDGRTTVVFGDVFYTEHAADLIASCEEPQPHWFRRPGPSKITGHEWDETFAFSFLPEHHHRVVEVAAAVNAKAASGRIRAAFMRCHYAAMLGLPDISSRTAICNTPHQTHIDDWTDDFDRFDEWCRWQGRYNAGRLDVGVAIPWCGGDADRTAAFEYTRNHFEQMGVPVYVGGDHTGGQWPNRSAMRNDAVRQALRHDVVFIADADTVVPAEQFWASAALTLTTGSLALAFTRFRRLSRSSTRMLYRGPVRDRDKRRVARGGQVIDTHASCAMAITPALWERTGGYDERFWFWGGEDRAFWLTALHFGGVTDRVLGEAWHLWHDRPEKTDDAYKPARSEMRQLGYRYKRACGFEGPAGILTDPTPGPADTEALIEILREPGGPLARQMEMT